MDHSDKLQSKLKVLIIGSNSCIAQALITELEQTHQVVTLSREQTDYSEASLAQHYRQFATIGVFDRIICCTGILHDQQVSPEKNLKQVNAPGLAHYFQVNTIVPMLCLKHFHSLLDRKNGAVFACLSAMVGSIKDNRAGGWYGYRSSKAALNMLVKTTAIEVARSNKTASIVAIHPGTTISDLSAPFAGNVSKEKYYTPQQSAKRIISVMANLSSKDSGAFLNWNGEPLPW